MSFSDLPLAQEIFDEVSTRISMVTHRNALLSDENPDPRLENWKKWLQERETINERLSKKLKRHPCELLANYGESLSSVKKDKLVLEYTKIPYPHDKYRGNPSFFEPPTALKRRQPCDPDYFAVKTKQDAHLIPEVEYVTVPKCIEEEKKLACTGYRSVQDVWLESAYRKQRVQELEDQLKIVEPFKPQLDDFCITGKALKASQGKSVKIVQHEQVVKDDFGIVYTPRPIIKDEVVLQFKPRAVRYNKHQNEEYISLNGIKLCPHNQKEERVIYLDFDYDISSKKPLTKEIEIKNSTSTAIRYYFTRVKKFHIFQDIVKPDERLVFFYDKRTNIIVPHEKAIYNVHFKTNETSSYTATLQFHMIPTMFRSKMFVKLTATSCIKDITEKIEIVKKYIEDKVKNSSVNDTVQDVLGYVSKPNSHVTLYTYDRGYIFEAINQKFSPTVRRPKYIYNKEVVDDLEAFYSKVRYSGCPFYWNYDVEVLKKITRQREKLDRQKATLDKIYLIKLEEMQRRKLLGDDINKEVELIKKMRKNSEEYLELPFSDRLEKIIKDLKDTISTRKEEEETLTTQLENILLKLDTTCYSINNMSDSYDYVYAILCITIDRIIFDVQKIEDTFGIKKTDRYPSDLKLLYLKGLQDEVFMHEHHPLYPKIEKDFTQDGLPPSEFLKDIPREDIKTRHVAYFGPQEIDDAKSKKGKKGKKDKKGDKKDKKADKKDKKGKDKKSSKDAKAKKSEKPSTPQVDLKAVPDFGDPFQQQTESDISLKTEKYQNSETISETISESNSTMSTEHQLDDYKFNLYKIFYKHLYQAIGRIADAIETSKPRKLKQCEFRTLWNRKITRGRGLKVKYIDIKKALCTAIGVKMRKRKGSKEKKRKEKSRKIKLTEPLRPKEPGSQWSILKPLWQPLLVPKPISYPELCLLIRRINIPKQSADVATIMSACSGFDHDWKDFQDIGVQAESDTYYPSTWESKGVASEIVQDIVGDVCDNDSTEDVESINIEEMSGGEEEDSDVFYDEDFSDSELNLDICDLYKPNA